MPNTIVRYHNHDLDIHRTITVGLDLAELRLALDKLGSTHEVEIDNERFSDVYDLLLHHQVPYTPDLTINQMGGKFCVR